MQNLFQKDVIIIVGGFSSGRYIAPHFNGLGYSCIHVCTKETKEHPLLKKTLNKFDYLENHILKSENEFDDFINKLKKYRIKAIIPGCEPCVEFADKLSEIFGTPRNVIASSEARRSKYLMHETLSKSGVNSAKQILTSSIHELFDFHKQVEKKIVLKPEASTNTDNIFYCESKQQIYEAAGHILGVKNHLGKINTKVLAQEYLSGKQYLVNTISSNGNHYICDAWSETRYNDDAPSNDSHADLIIPGSNIYKELSIYTVSVLDSLGILYGLAHLEIRMTNRGLCLVEIAARLSGNVDFSILYSINGLTQLSLLADAFLDTSSFIKRISNANPITKSARKVYLSSPVSGDVLKDPDLDLLMNINSVNSLYFRIKKGDYLYETNRAQGKARPGHIYMVANNSKQIEDEYKLVRQNEELLYKMMISPSKSK